MSSRNRRRGITRESGKVSFFAFFGLASGFLVDVAMAAVFGAGAETDAFFIAATIPLTIAATVLAAANQALVPLVHSWFKDRDQAEAEHLTSQLFGGLLSVALAIGAAGMLLSPLLPRLVAPGSAASTQSQAVWLSVILFGAIVARITSEVMRAVLNARRRFAVAAASPLAMNLTALGMTLGFGTRFGISAVATGYLVGAILQMALLYFSIRLGGVKLRPRLGVRNDAVRSALRLLALPVGATGLNAIARSLERVIASFLPEGSITLLNYAWRLVNGIGGTVFFRSVAVVLIPSLADALDDRRRLTQELARGIRVMAAIAMALVAFVSINAHPGIELAFGRRAFESDDTYLLAQLLIIYSFSFPAAALTRATLALFYARMDMVRPFVNNVVVISTNVFLALVLSRVIGLEGLAVAYVVATSVGLAHGVWAIRSQVSLRARPVFGMLVRSGVASFAGALTMRLTYESLPTGRSLIGRALGLGIGGLAGLAVLGAGAVLLSGSVGTVVAVLRGDGSIGSKARRLLGRDTSNGGRESENP